MSSGRPTLFRSLILGLIASALASALAAQQASQLDCNGVFAGAQATVAGVRQFAPTSALGDGYVRFEGTIAAAGMQGRIAYEGYTRTTPFTGIVQGPLGEASIGVLDNTGGSMIIYSGAASLGPPTILGQFTCAWR